MKRIISIILTTLTLMSHITVPVMAENEGYYWLEAEDAVYSDKYHEVSSGDASGGKYLAVYETSQGEYTVEFTFQNESKGRYDIWFLSGKGTSRQLTKFKWSMNDGGENAAPSTDTNNVYSDKYNDIECEFYWNKITSVNLESGNVTIRFNVANKSENKIESIEKAWFNYIDAAVVVPSVWKWTPNGITKPEKPEIVPSDFVWIELENPDTPGTYMKTKSNSSASDGNILFANDVKPAEGITEETAVYSFGADKETEYDIWYLGIQTNVEHLSKLEWCIDGDGMNSNSVDYKKGESPTSYEVTVLGSKFPMYWQKMGTKSISIGDHILSLKYNIRTTGSAVFAVAADCVAIVPSELEWTPDNSDAYELKGRIVAKRFVKEHNDYFNKDFSNVTDNISLPNGDECAAFKNQLDAKITFSADTFEGREVMASDGTITRPYATASSDAEINLYVNAEYEDKNGKKHSGSYAIPIKVKKWEKYEITEALSVDKQSLVGGEKITASVKSNIHVGNTEEGIVTILMVLYDKNGSMQGISMGEEKGSGEKNVNAEITLPEDVTGSELKVYLLNGIKNSNRIGNTISIK